MNVSDIRFYVWLGLRRIHYFAAAVILCSIAGLIVALNVTPKYKATAKLLLESPQIPPELARTTVPDTSIDQIQIIEQEIKTRRHLMDLAKRLNVYPTGIEQMTEADVVDDLYDRLIFEQVPLPSGGTGVAVFAISFVSPDRELSAKVVNDVVSFVLSKNALSRADRATETTQFFQQESARLGEKLGRIEQEILDFKNTHTGSLPDSLEFRRTQQTNLEERLVTLNQEDSALRSRRLNLMKLNELGIRPTGSIAANPAQQTLAELNKALTMQLALFSETSPNIVALRAQIAALKAQIGHKEGTEEADRTGADVEPDIAEIDQRLSFIEGERITAKAELVELTASIEATPTTETALTALARNRDNIQAQYNAAVEKLAAASTAERMEVGSRGARFSVVEAAIPPQHSIGPKRKLIALAGLAAGLGLGAALVVLPEFLTNALRRPADVVRVLDVQPLASIPYIERPPHRAAPRWRRLVARAAVALCFIAGPFEWQTTGEGARPETEGARPYLPDAARS